MRGIGISVRAIPVSVSLGFAGALFAVFGAAFITLLPTPTSFYLLGLLALMGAIAYLSVKPLLYTLYLLILSLPLTSIFNVVLLGGHIKISDFVTLLLIVLAAGRFVLGKCSSIRFPPATAAFILFFSLQTLSLVNYLFIPSPVRDMQGAVGFINSPQVIGIKQILWGLYSFAATVVTYGLIDRKDKLFRAMSVLFAVSVLASAYGIIQVVGSVMGVDTGLKTTSDIWVAPRLQATSAEAGFFAAFLTMIIPVSVVTYVGKAYMVNRRFHLVGVCILFAALVMTFSSAGWLSIVVALTAVFYCLISKKYNLGQIAGKVLRFIGLAALVAIASGIVLIPQFSLGVKEAVLTKFYGTASMTERVVWMEIALRMFLDYPVLGVGVGNYGNLFFEYVPRETPAFFHHSFTSGNLYSLTLAETGLPGTSTLILLEAAILRSIGVAARRSDDPRMRLLLVGCLGGVIAQFVHQVAVGTFYLLYFWIFLGIALAATNLSRRDQF